MRCGITGSGTFLFIWIGFMALMVVGLSLILLWAIRTRQFSNQDRARHLPLLSGIPGEGEIAPLAAPPLQGEGQGEDGFSRGPGHPSPTCPPP